jgi:hypothetical protein
MAIIIKLITIIISLTLLRKEMKNAGVPKEK